MDNAEDLDLDYADMERDLNEDECSDEEDILPQNPSVASTVTSCPLAKLFNHSVGKFQIYDLK